MGRLAAVLFVCVMAGLAPALAQIPDLEALERELERLKAEQTRQEAEARRRQEAEARRRAQEEAEARRRAQEEAEARRRAQEEEAARRHAEMLAGPRWNQFEPVPHGVMDWGQNVIWAPRDNGRDISWGAARNFCSALGSGWSLPSVAQLESLYAPVGPHSREIRIGTTSRTIHPATDLIQVTGLWYWSAEARGSSEAWLVNLSNGLRLAFHQSYSYYYRALCVRRP